MNREIAEALENCFISPNVSDSNYEPANLVDVVKSLSVNTRRIADSITTLDAIPAEVGGGGRVGCLTESVLYLGKETGRVADAIFYLADTLGQK